MKDGKKSGAIPGVNEEVRYLHSVLSELSQHSRIEIEVEAIFTEQATDTVVQEKLKRCPYHIVHYAGHGTFHESPEKSCLHFWEKPGCKGDVISMPASKLALLLEQSDTHLFYLSCCSGAAVGERAKLLDDDFLGIADSLVHAGIPAVLGYRWPVSDSGAQELAKAFYTSLAFQGQIDTALLEARRQVAAGDRDDITWLSPILIMQGR